MSGPCLCGDTDCPTCGTAQGTREPSIYECGCSRLKVKAGRCDVFDVHGMPRSLGARDITDELRARVDEPDDEPHPIDVGDLDDGEPVYASDLLDGITEALRNLPDDCGRLDTSPAPGYPPGWPSCACGLPALDGHLTCGTVTCDERAARARAAVDDPKVRQ